MTTPHATCRRTVRPATSARVALAAAALWTAAPAGAAEPLSAWLEGLGEAAVALDGGDAAGSLAAAQRARLALPQGRAGARAAAAEGLARLALGEDPQAVEPLRVGQEGVAPEAVAPLRLALGQALLEAGRAGEAASVLEQAAGGGALRLARRARWLQGRALLASGQEARGAERLESMLQEAPQDPEASAARLELAGALRRLGQTTRALALYRAMALDTPERPEGSAALAALARWQEAGGPGSDGASLSGEDRLVRAERLLARGRNAEALSEVDAAAAATPPADPARAALQRALILLAQGRQAEAEALVRPLTASPSAGLRRGATWVLARVASRAGRLEEASSAYALVAAGTGGLPGLPEDRWGDLADEAGYLSAWLWYDAGRLDLGARRLEAFARAHPASRRADDARWFAAWARVRLGARPQARRALARLERGPFADASLYWQGRLATSATAAVTFYRRAVAAAPDGWYGALARARLAGLGEDGRREGAPTPLPPLELGEGPAAVQLAAASALLGLGLREAARAELEALLRPRATAAVTAPLAELASFAGEVDLSFRAARDRLGATRRTGRWLYPEPLPALARLARAAGTDPDLLRALVRRESAFRPGVRSVAGALGLTQLLPGTAARLGALSGLAVDPSSRLSEPETSVALGALYLGLLLDRFRVEGVALAAYNAGPSQAAGWARAQAGRPLDEWVEAIAYKETRGYVKSVLAAREAYRRLAGRPPRLDPDEPIPPPEEGAAF